MGKPSVPFSDSAMFEYIGRGIVHGGRLYGDFWDNKLPSVYLVNAVWQASFGSRYAWHAIAEACVVAASIALFARLLYRYAIPGWAPATLAFAVALAIPVTANTVESYALPGILLSYLWALGRKPVRAGIALAAATTFWIPCVLLLLPLVCRKGDARRSRPLVLAYLAASAAFVGVSSLIWGAGTLLALAQSWYPCVSGHRSVIGEHLESAFFGGLISSGSGVLLAALALVVRRPRDDRERFALIWAGAAACAVLALQNFFDHHFIPATAAFVFAIAVFSARAPRPGLVRFGVCSLLIALFAWQTAVWEGQSLSGVPTVVAHVLETAKRIRETSGPGAPLRLGRYEPGIYLAADATLPDRFAMVPARSCQAGSVSSGKVLGR